MCAVSFLPSRRRGQLAFALVALVALSGCAPDEPGSTSGPGPVVQEGGQSEPGPALFTTKPIITCLDLMRCDSECQQPSGCSATCTDLRKEAPESTQSSLSLLGACRAAAQCDEMTCAQSACSNELTSCFQSSTAVGGTEIEAAIIPAGHVPPELVGLWVSSGIWGETELEFRADGTVTHRQTKRSRFDDCEFSVASKWEGSTVESGDELEITLAPGTTNAVFVEACGTNAAQPTRARKLLFRYYVQPWKAPPRLYLTEHGCARTECSWIYAKQ